MGLAFVLGCGVLLAGCFLDISCLGHYAEEIYVGFLVSTLLMRHFSPWVGGVPFYARYEVLCALAGYTPVGQRPSGTVGRTASASASENSLRFLEFVSEK